MAGQENLAQEALEIVEEQVEVVEKSASLLARIVWNHKTHVITAAVVAGGVGAYAGYRYAEKQLQTKFDDLVREEIRETKEYYRVLYKDKSPEEILLERHGEVVTPAEAAASAHKSYLGEAEAPAETEEELMTPEERALHEKHAGDPRRPVEEVVEEIERRNVFDQVADFDYGKEIALRTETSPYIITYEEYYNSEKEYEQTDLTYYEGDGVLADARDEVIPEPDKIVGEDHLARFGYGSNDKDTVFVRNDVIEVEFEITRSYGSYAKEVLGFDTEEEGSMKHSAISPGNRRFRDRDE